MSLLKFSLVLLVFLVLVSKFSVSIVFAQTSEAEAASALVTSENAVVSAYQAVSKAEDAGANVTGLLVRLNEAGWFLNRGRMAYELGDFDSVIEFAVQCQEKLSGLIADADMLRENAIYERSMNFLFSIAGSFVGAVAIVCFSILVWFFLKKYDKAGGVV